ncbi:DUF4258 domain-containing protein [Antarcticibacterium flavum]|uniref:DUF4258 domain-containing protein n=1 Tax=Antarcticibacterium flavum TaxID=2058175 RepID=A0A5B7WYV1_9FLAO|nr:MULTISPECIES: DUF4258 domain-containing protein [Antarcticibacterium]MCM4158989.1 hypothetical protein [Antarcticibacterium sp. W02-3]QCY68240.1 DUF4258 domain-containing protein [Antarcticibacterium flavum]
MKIIHRFAYFSVGLFFGIVILIFFLGGKRTSCDYSPTARVLKNIRIKDRIFTDEALQFFAVQNIDTSGVSSILKNGKVDFGKSKTDNDPCNIYFVSGEFQEKVLELQIENCETTATIQKAELLD